MTEWKGKTRGGVFGYLFFIFLIKKIGITAAYAFLSTIVLYFIPFAPKASKSIWIYSRKILNKSLLSSIGMLFRSYYKFGQTLIDKVAIGNGMKDKYNFRFENYDEFLNILNTDTGTIIIGAHVGNWEMGTPFFDDYGKKINIVLYDAEYRRIKELLQKNSASADFKVIPVNDTDLNHVFAIKEALDNKEYICFQGDRYINEERRLKGIFMGKETSFPLGPFLLAAKMKVPVVFYFSMREPKKTYTFHFTMATPVYRNEEIRPEQQLLHQYISALEAILKKYPEQWFNYYNFWNEK
ncbi:acyltransferase [Dysgonomonas sp. GY75]|uniref:LpxL/LpxP family acyltransferase n=1 Tax=Dysgonomonas sp. GY75 TaxID=2780419 RepID=UPI0018841715|nr:acyltransferase [Dysgonomonas sp. GY75]MBF0651130.1 acyltransferase [Dysgonomonas sp. GY75]